MGLPYIKLLPGIGPLPALALGPEGPVVAQSLPYSHSMEMNSINSVNRGFFEPVSATRTPPLGVTKGGHPWKLYAEGARADSFGFVDGTGLRPKGPTDGTVWI